MSRKTFMVFDKDNVHEHNLIVEETDKGIEYSLFMSNNEQWNLNYRDKLVLSMLNDGNGLIFNKKLKKMNYSDSFAVRLLLNFENFMDTNPMNKDKVKIVEDKIVIEL